LSSSPFYSYLEQLLVRASTVVEGSYSS
jgi:hypothetical protein